MEIVLTIDIAALPIEPSPGLYRRQEGGKRECTINVHPNISKSAGHSKVMKIVCKGPRPRIGVDLHTLEGLHQGSRTHSLELFSRVFGLLPEIDFCFLVDTGRWDPANTDRFTGPNAQVVHIPHRSAPKRLLWQLPRLSYARGIDLLHTQYICPQFLAPHTAITIHDILCDTHPQYFEISQKLRSRVLFRSSAARSALIFTVSDYSRKMLEQVYRLPSGRVVTLYNSVSAERFYPGTNDNDRVAALGLVPGEYLLAVGRLEPRKNHLNLLRAFTQLPQPRPKLVIVGQRDFGFQEIFRLREQLKLGPDVLMLENVDDTLLPALYRNARVMVYPSFAEGFGMPLLEAMASGTPVITSDSTALSEVAGDAALLVDPHSVESLRRGLERLLTDSGLQQSLRLKGLKRAALFTWEMSAGVLAQSYQQFFFA